MTTVFVKQPQSGKKKHFFVNFDFFGIQILPEKMRKLQQFEIATTLRKSLFWTFIWLDLIKFGNMLLKIGGKQDRYGGESDKNWVLQNL